MVVGTLDDLLRLSTTNSGINKGTIMPLSEKP